MGQIIRGTKLLFAWLSWSPVEACREACCAAVALGGGSALLAKLSGKSGSLAKALVIFTNSCEDAPERRAAGRAGKAIKAETFVRVPLKESAFLGKAKAQLVLCSNTVSYPFHA